MPRTVPRAWLIVALALACASAADAFGPRPRPRLYAKPHLPPHLVAAERALRELAPGGPAAAGLLSDGRWRADDDPASPTDAAPSSAAGASASVGDSGADAKARRAEEKANNLKKYEEYFLRSRAPPARASSSAADARLRTGGDSDALDPSSSSSAHSASVDDPPASYAAELDGASDSESGVVPTNRFGVATTEASEAEAGSSLSPVGEGSGPLVPARTDIALDPASFADVSTRDMFEQLKREADAYVNPQTGVALRWGDTWRHAWGGGVGVGRPENRPRRMAADGTTQIMPAATDAGYALVPTSSDKRALEEFYDECNGLRWSVQRNWGVGEPCANGWHGVVCHGGRVTELWMNLNNVACWGKFNVTALARLDELLVLDLSDNLFDGEIPEALFSMTKLQSLVLSSNRLSGTLSERFAELKSLRHLDLSANGLSGTLPPAMGEMERLEVLYLGESGLEVKHKFEGKIPEAWRGLRALERLSLQGASGLRGKFPTWIASAWPRLEELTLADCGLTGTLPESIDQLRYLRTLDVAGNKLAGEIPEGVGRLRKLKHLRLGRNQLEGAVPAAIADLGELETLDVGGNRLTGALPDSFANLGALEYLDVSRNAFEGPLPAALPSMSALRVFLAHGNRFRGPVPASLFTDLPHLAHLYLDDNALDGHLPADDAIARAVSLKEFHAARNAFEGSRVPAGFGSLARLASLQLSRCGLEGEIPPELGRAGELARLDLSGNRLAGSIPASLANASELAEIKLGGNKLAGTIPRAFRRLRLLRELRAERNRLAGEIPDWFASHANVRAVDLSHNRLTGRLPSSLWDPDADDGEGGVGALTPLPKWHDRPVGAEEREYNFAGNPLFCPLPDWADEVRATCKAAEIESVEPSVGPSRGGTRVTIRGVNLAAGGTPGDDGAAPGDARNDDGRRRGAGCLFGKAKDAVWVAAEEAEETRVVCVSPPRRPGASTPSVVVRVGHDGEAVTRFGELFRYV